jgi:hypothetical protein
VEQIEEHDGHVPAHTLSLSEHGLDPLMAIASTRLTVEHG